MLLPFRMNIRTAPLAIEMRVLQEIVTSHCMMPSPETILHVIPCLICWASRLTMHSFNDCSRHHADGRIILRAIVMACGVLVESSLVLHGQDNRRRTVDKALRGFSRLEASKLCAGTQAHLHRQTPQDAPNILDFLLLFPTRLHEISYQRIHVQLTRETSLTYSSHLPRTCCVLLTTTHHAADRHHLASARSASPSVNRLGFSPTQPPPYS